MRTIVLDTNVLLTQPDAIYDFGVSDIVIPDVVLAEIDKLKMGRVDPELRYKGRSLSRQLFQLAESGDLSEGVDLPTGGRVRVVTLNEDRRLPDGMSPRNADDRILAVALQEREAGAKDLTVVTNDLNMLLRAQGFGIKVERAATDGESWARRWVVRPLQRYKVPIGILAVALAVFAAIVYLVAFSPLSTGRQTGSLASLPNEFLNQLSLEQQQALNLLYKLEADPDDVDSQRNLAVLYDQMSGQNPAYLPYAIQHYEALLKVVPNDTDSRTDLASAFYRAGKLNRAVEEVEKVLQQQPEHVNANFNLGVFYLNMQPKQYQKAADQFAKTIRLGKQQNRQDAVSQATTLLDQVKKEAAAAGKPVKTTGGTL